MSTRIVDAFANTPLFLSPSNQPYSILPSGNSVPLWSEAFYSHLTVAFPNHGIPPNPGQFSFLRRYLDAQIHSNPNYQPVSLRTHQTGPKSYRLDLDNSYGEIIELNSHGWTIATDLDTRFYRPETSIPFEHPVRITEKLHHCLQKLLHLERKRAQDLAKWLVAALLPGQTTPVLILTGKARTDAAIKIRNLIDPAASSLLDIPQAPMQLAQLALTNNLLAFTMYKELSPAKIEAINKIRTGTEVLIKDSSKFRPALRETLRRPILITAEAAPHIHEEQLILEVNETSKARLCDIFAALLTEAAHFLAMNEEAAAAPLSFQLDQSQPPHEHLNPGVEGPAP